MPFLKLLKLTLVVLLFMPYCYAQKNADYIITPLHRTVKLLWNGKSGSIQWIQNGKSKILRNAFYVKERDVVGYPRFERESQDYIVLRYGCGSPCWIEIFLPLYKNGNPTIIEDPFVYDLGIDRVAGPGGINGTFMEILNLRTRKKQSFYPDSCTSAFIGYCIDTAYFEGNKFVYYWNAQATFDNRRSAKNKKSVVLNK